ncbi:MAG: M48 family metallopeptidase [bacterium]|nr:M48 family metallopeptidase [bacterium]
MHDAVAANVRRSWLIILVFAVFVGLVAYAFAALLELGELGVAFAVVAALVSAWGGYFYSDRLALAVSGARPARKDEFPYLVNITEALALGAGIPAPRIYVIDDDAPNAFATGRNPKQGVVAVTTGLLAKLDRAELEGVVGHEISHIANYDILVATLAVTMVGIVALLGDWMARAVFYGHRGSRRSSSRGGERGAGFLLLAAMLLAIVAPLVAQLLRLAVSRQREYLADSSAALLTRYPPGLAAALRKIAADPQPLRAANPATAHLYIYNPLLDRKHRLDGLFNTHPPIQERIRRLEAL